MSKRALLLAAVVVAAIAHWCGDAPDTTKAQHQPRPTTWKDRA